MTTILVADDDPSVRRIVGKAAKTLCDEVVAVEDGAQAWEQLQTLEDVTLIISDWMMPNLDGPELLQKVRNDLRTKTLPFLMLTARDSDDDVVESFSQGADEYVKKPFSLTELLARAKSLIKMHNMQEELRQRAMTDGMTGLLNQSSFKERLENELARSHRYGSELCLLMMDLDHFKRVNDTHGHPAGDAVLEALSEILRKAVRKADVLARYGGEEFAALLPSTPMDGAKILAGRILEDVRTHTFAWEDKTIPLTISVGLAQLAEKESADMFLRRADEALYDAKRSGRDRLCVAE